MGAMAGPLAVATECASLPEADIADFGAWMATEQRRVLQLCRRFLGDRDEADCASQDTFLKAWEALRKPGAAPPDDPGKWIIRIAVNTCLDRLRSRKWQFWRRRPRAEVEQVLLAMQHAANPSPERSAQSLEIDLRFRAAIAALPLKQRAVITLRHYEGMSLEEIGSALGLETGTVKAHLFRAVSKLRVELRDLYGVRS